MAIDNRHFTKDVTDTVRRDTLFHHEALTNVYGDSGFQIETFKPANFSLYTKQVKQNLQQTFTISAFAIATIALFAGFLLGAIFVDQLNLPYTNNPQILGVQEKLYQD